MALRGWLCTVNGDEKKKKEEGNLYLSNNLIYGDGVASGFLWLWKNCTSWDLCCALSWLSRSRRIFILACDICCCIVSTALDAFFMSSIVEFGFDTVLFRVDLAVLSWGKRFFICPLSFVYVVFNWFIWAGVNCNALITSVFFHHCTPWWWPWKA